MRYPFPPLLLLALAWSPGAHADLLEDTRSRLLALPADGRAAVEVALPLADGGTALFRMVDSRTLPRDLLQRYPGLRSFRGLDAEGRHARLDYAPGRARLSVRGADGTRERDLSVEAMSPGLPAAAPAKATSEATSTVATATVAPAFPSARPRRAVAHGPVRYEFRLALAAGSKFVATHGGTRQAALGALVHMTNRANDVLENDLGVHITLAARTDRLIVTDAGGDPLGEGEPRTAAATLISRRLSAHTYDLGHAFVGLDGGETDTGTVCSDALDADYLATHKAAAWSGGADADGAFANFLLVLGNQLGAPFRDNRCWHCLAFDGASIERVRAWLASRGGRCARKQLVDAIAPWIDPAVPEEPRVVPAGTPFWLDAAVQAGTPGRRLSYAWDDISVPARFRDIAPHAALRRDFTSGLPDASGRLDFRLTVRDNGGADASTASADTHVLVVDTGRPFALEPVVDASAGSALGIRWDPAGTTLAPISCHFLDAWLSIDNGARWQILARDLPNNGAAVLTLPTDIRSEAARLRVACDWRPFFAEAPAPFSIR